MHWSIPQNIQILLRHPRRRSRPKHLYEHVELEVKSLSKMKLWDPALVSKPFKIQTSIPTRSSRPQNQASRLSQNEVGDLVDLERPKRVNDRTAHGDIRSNIRVEGIYMRIVTQE